MHCRHFVSRSSESTRHAPALRQRLWRAGAGRPASRAGLRCRPVQRPGGPRRQPVRWLPGPVISRAGPGASSSCTWTAARPRWTRSTPSPGSIASTASRSRSRRIPPSSTTWATCSRCPWKFRQYGESGIPVSDLFPHVGASCRRPGHHPVDGLEFLGAHERQLLPAHRQRPSGAAQPRRLGDLRPGKRVPGPARASSSSTAA